MSFTLYFKNHKNQFIFNTEIFIPDYIVPLLPFEKGEDGFLRLKTGLVYISNA